MPYSAADLHAYRITGRFFFKMPDWDSGYEVDVMAGHCGSAEQVVQAAASRMCCKLSEVPPSALFLPLPSA